MEYLVERIAKKIVNYANVVEDNIVSLEPCLGEHASIGPNEALIFLKENNLQKCSEKLQKSINYIRFVNFRNFCDDDFTYRKAITKLAKNDKAYDFEIHKIDYEGQQEPSILSTIAAKSDNLYMLKILEVISDKNANPADAYCTTKPDFYDEFIVASNIHYDDL